MRWETRASKLRRKIEIINKKGWEKYFCWFPIEINGENVWLEWVERKRTAYMPFIMGNSIGCREEFR